MKKTPTRRDVSGSHRVRRNRRTPTGAGTGVRPREGGTAHRFLPLLVAAVGFAAVGVAAHFGWEAACTSERLRIAEVELVGNVRVPAPEIRAYTDISVGDPILRASLDGAALNLRRHPWIRTARVLRRLPDRIVIEIEEHQPEVVVALAEPYLANADGELFKRLSARDRVVLPVVTGIDRDQAARDPEATGEMVRQAIALSKAMQRAGQPLGLLDELHWDRDLGWSVVTRPKPGRRPLRVHLGFDANARMLLAASALGHLKTAGRWPDELWVDGEKHPRRAHVRLQAVNHEKRNPS
jgi:cell division septal protein FtsQ